MYLLIYSNTTIVVNENLFKDISDNFIIEVCKFFKHYIDKVEIEENSLVIRVDDIKCFLNKSSENLEKRFTKLKKDNQIKILIIIKQLTVILKTMFQ